jgi:hypothetical protein
VASDHDVLAIQVPGQHRTELALQTTAMRSNQGTLQMAATPGLAALDPSQTASRGPTARQNTPTQLVNSSAHSSRDLRGAEDMLLLLVLLGLGR